MDTQRFDRNQLPDTFLYKEIRQQPETLARLIEQQREHIASIADEIRSRDPRFVYLAARGSSDNAAMYAKYAFSSICGLPTSLAAPSLFTVYRTPPRLRDALVVGISQSGEAPDILEVVREAKRQGALSLAITNNLHSPLAVEADFHVYLHAGEEVSVAATKTYTAQLVALAALAAALAGDAAHRSEIEEVPDAVRTTLSLEERVADVAERYRYMDRCVVIGRGFNYSTAFELALKLSELTYVLAEPYSSVDFLHGPIAVIHRDFPAFLMGPRGAVLPGLREIARRLEELGSEIVAFSDDEEILGRATVPIQLPAHIGEWLSPVTTIVAGQLFAMHLTAVMGRHPDRPRGLAKVTRTR